MNPFSERASRIKFEATMASSDATFEVYKRDNPKHVGLTEIELLSAENSLLQALESIRRLRAACAENRANAA